MSLLSTMIVLIKADTTHAERSLNDVSDKSDDAEKRLKKVGKSGKKSMRDIKKGAEEATDSVGKLKDGVKHGAESFKDLVKDAAITYLGILGISKGVEGVFKTMDYATMIKDGADALGMMVEDVDAFAKASQAVGGDAEGARDSLVDMAEVIGEGFADANSAHGKLFKELKINLKDAKGESIDALEGLLRLSDAVSGMDKQKAIYYIKALGITDKKTVELVTKGRKELEKMLDTQRKNGVLSTEQAEKAKEFQLKTLELKNAFQQLSMEVGIFVIPVITSIGSAFRTTMGFLKEHALVAKGAFVIIASAITAIMLPALSELAVKAWLAVAPFIPLALGIAAIGAVIGIVYEDIMAFKDGNDSLIGLIIEKYPIIGQIFQTFGDIAKIVIRGVVDYFKLLKSEIILIRDSFLYLGNVVNNAFDGFLNRFPTIAKWLKVIKDAISGVIGGLGSILGDKISIMQNEIHTGAKSTKANELERKQIIREKTPSVQERLNSSKAYVESANVSPFNSVHTQTQNNNNNTQKHINNTVQIGHVTVETKATDAGGIAQSLGDEMARHAKNIHNSWDSGVVI